MNRITYQAYIETQKSEFGCTFIESAIGIVEKSNHPFRDYFKIISKNSDLMRDPSQFRPLGRYFKELKDNCSRITQLLMPWDDSNRIAQRD